jgi:hypothetical protein
MRRTAARLLTGVLVLGSAGLGFLPLAHADQTQVVAPETEGWYQPNPSCAQASGCVTTGSLPVAPPVELPLSPYPAGTLHVGWAGASKESARTYLSFPFAGLSGTLTGAVLDIPLDTAPADGDTQSATAKIQACLVTGATTAVDGSIAPPPATSCDQHAQVTYVATPAPHLHADLAPILVGLPTTSGIVLLPDATANTDTDAWRVVFSSHTRTDAAKTAPAALTLSIAEQPVVSTPESPTVDLPAAPVDSGFAPAPSTGFVAAPQVQAPQAPAVVAPLVPAVVPPAAPVTAAQTITVGYAYPAVWLLPLVFLVLVPMATKALTRDLDLT